MIHDYISFQIFFISFAVGLLFVYLIGPEIKTIYIYPTPENVDKVLFKDKAENCFYFEPEIVECPEDTNLISNIPIQT
jgi:hypothetical protein